MLHVSTQSPPQDLLTILLQDHHLRNKFSNKTISSLAFAYQPTIILLPSLVDSHTRLAKNKVVIHVIACLLITQVVKFSTFPNIQPLFLKLSRIHFDWKHWLWKKDSRSRNITWTMGSFLQMNSKSTAQDNIKRACLVALGQNTRTGLPKGTLNSCAVGHVATHWPQHANTKNWPQAISYAAWVFNRLPNMESGIAPNEIWSGVHSPSSKLSRTHVFGCPVYVLDASLQDGKKISKWNPCARLGLFLGFSDLHSSQVPLVLNIATGHISPQFHVIFDNKFETINSLPLDQPLKKQWAQIITLGRKCFMDVDYDENNRPILPSLLDIIKSYSEAKSCNKKMSQRWLLEVILLTSSIFHGQTHLKNHNNKPREQPDHRK